MESRTFDTPVENRRQVAISASSCCAAGVGQAIELGAPAELRHAPLGLDPAPAFEAVEGRIERPLFDEDGVAARVLDESGDGVSVARAPG